MRGPVAENIVGATGTAGACSTRRAAPLDFKQIDLRLGARRRRWRECAVGILQLHQLVAQRVGAEGRFVFFLLPPPPAAVRQQQLRRHLQQRVHQANGRGWRTKKLIRSARTRRRGDQTSRPSLSQESGPTEQGENNARLWPCPGSRKVRTEAKVRKGHRPLFRLCGRDFHYFASSCISSARDQRHRAASIIASGHRRAVEVVAPRRAGSGARTDVDKLPPSSVTCAASARHPR